MEKQTDLKFMVTTVDTKWLVAAVEKSSHSVPQKAAALKYF